MKILNMFTAEGKSTLRKEEAVSVRIESTYDEAWLLVHEIQKSNRSKYSMYFKNLNETKWYITGLDTVGKACVVPCSIYNMFGQYR